MVLIFYNICSNYIELKLAFDFFDPKQKGHITMQDLKSRLGVFYKNLQPREYKFLMNNQPELTYDQLYALLADNELSNFDPVAEAFKIYDPTDSGFINIDILSDIFSNLGFGKLSNEDLRILIETADCDHDGKISLEDFRHMLDDKNSNLIQEAEKTQILKKAGVPLEVPSNPQTNE